MQTFKYRARNNAGQLLTGTVEAETAVLAARILVERGWIPVTVKTGKADSDVLRQLQRWYATKKLGISDLMIFSRQMYSMSKAGVPLIRAIRSMLDSTRNSALAEALESISHSLEAGRSLAQAMAQHDRIFDPLYISLIAVGENTGMMDRTFLQISQYLEREKQTRSRIKAALRYPSMVFVTIGIAMVILNIMVIPAFQKVFDKFHGELPLPTRIIINISSFSIQYWPYIAAALLLAGYGLYKYIATDQGRLQWHRMLLHIPVIGSILERATMERFSRSFAMILNSGIPLTQGIDIVARSVGNDYIGSKLEQMRSGVEKGESISRTAQHIGLFPTLVIQMILVGEETGNIGDMLLEVADFYEIEIDADLKNLSSAIEPLLLIIIGAMVLVLALGIFLPMWNLSTTLR